MIDWLRSRLAILWNDFHNWMGREPKLLQPQEGVARCVHGIETWCTLCARHHDHYFKEESRPLPLIAKVDSTTTSRKTQI